MNKIKRMIALLDHDRVGYVEVAFKVIYILHLLMSFNIFITGQSILNITVGSVILLGCFLLLCRVCHVRLYLRTPGVMFLAFFVVSFLIPSFLIYRYDLFSSIKTVLWMAFQFCILFCFSTGKKETVVKKEFLAVSISLLSFATLENIFSLLMLITEYYSPYQTPDGTYFLAGLTPWGRLYGVHTDPNYACVYTLTAILIAAYLIKKFKNVFAYVILALTALINFVFVVLTASRTGLVCIIVATACYVLFLFLKNLKKKILLRAAVLTVFAVVLILGVYTAVIKGYNGINALLAENSAFDQSGGATTTTPPATSDRVNVGRTEEELGGDISNRRFDIWLSGLEIFKENPVFGIGFENVLGYAHDQMPETYIVNNDLSDFDAFHNALVDVLVSQGIVGILLLLGFVVKYLAAFCKNYFKISTTCRDEAILCLTICLTTVASAMFLSHVFYVNCPTTYIFWAYSGYLMYFLFNASSKPTMVTGGDCLDMQNNEIEMENSGLKKEKILTVSVAAYNVEKFMRQCLDSFVNSGVIDDIEVIVTDDGSKDSTPDIVAEYVARFPESIVLVQQPNAGPGSTVNSGIRHASGKYFRMVDGDDWVNSVDFAQLIVFLKKIDADAVINDYIMVDNDTAEQVPCVLEGLKSGTLYSFANAAPALKISMHNFIVKTEIMKQHVKLFNCFYTDMQYLLFPAGYIKDIVYYDLKVYMYRVSLGTQSMSIPSLQRNIAMHESVLRSLIEYYNDYKQSERYQKAVGDYIVLRIVGMAGCQMSTYLSFDPSKERRTTLYNFFDELKQASSDVYMAFVKLNTVKILRLSKLFYRPISIWHRHKLKGK